jgi:type II restriction enzyme
VQINLGQVPVDFDNLTDVMFSEMQTEMRLNRVGVANAADRGIDIISNFGPIIQVKHVDLTEELVIDICAGLPNSQVVIVGRNIETEVVSSIDENRPNNLLGIYSLSDINQWYESVRDSIEISNSQKEQLMDILHDSMIAEFPHLGQMGLFCTERGYDI